MKYTIRAGRLYSGDGDEILCRIKGIISEEKRVEDAAGWLCLSLRVLRNKEDKSGDIRFYRYVMLDPQGAEISSASPDYAHEEDPRKVGWPFGRLPRADRAIVRWKEQQYHLRMRDTCTYVMTDCFDQEAACLVHRGIKGGWNVTAREVFSPAMVCGLFVFCRYLERENDMPLL